MNISLERAKQLVETLHETFKEADPENPLWVVAANTAIRDITVEAAPSFFSKKEDGTVCIMLRFNANEPNAAIKAMEQFQKALGLPTEQPRIILPERRLIV